MKTGVIAFQSPIPVILKFFAGAAGKRFGIRVSDIHAMSVNLA